jgi:hypothetical protein
MSATPCHIPRIPDIFDNKKMEKEGQKGERGGREWERRERKENNIKRLKVKFLINDTYGNICIYGRVVEMIYNKQVMIIKIF